MGHSRFSLFPRTHRLSESPVILPLRNFQIYTTCRCCNTYTRFSMEIAVIPQLKNDGNFSVLQNSSSQWKEIKQLEVSLR